jgi:hypothetical protein
MPPAATYVYEQQAGLRACGVYHKIPELFPSHEAGLLKHWFVKTMALAVVE